MKLYLMRHGPAEDHAHSGLDADRALTAKGRHRVADVARCLDDAGEAPLHIVSSPLVRAVQTAEIVAAVTALHGRKGSLSVRPELGLGAGGLVLIDELRRAPCKRTMLVGHEPGMSALVAHLVGTPLTVPFGKAMIVGVALDRDAARLRFVLDPKELRIEHV
jgi:phosphohistidine phosphatase